MNAPRTLKRLASRYGSIRRLRHKAGENKAARIERAVNKHRNKED